MRPWSSGLVLRQLGHPQVIRPCGDVAGGKGCPPAANDLVRTSEVNHNGPAMNLAGPLSFSRRDSEVIEPIDRIGPAELARLGHSNRTFPT